MFSPFFSVSFYCIEIIVDFPLLCPHHLAASSQFLNFVLMPLYLRTAFMGCCAFLWATFLCFSRQDGDGTAAVALAFVMDPRKTLEEIREARLARKKQKTQREN